MPAWPLPSAAARGRGSPASGRPRPKPRSTKTWSSGSEQVRPGSKVPGVGNCRQATDQWSKVASTCAGSGSSARVRVGQGPLQEFFAHGRAGQPLQASLRRLPEPRHRMPGSRKTSQSSTALVSSTTPGTGREAHRLLGIAHSPRLAAWAVAEYNGRLFGNFAVRALGCAQAPALAFKRPRCGPKGTRKRSRKGNPKRMPNDHRNELRKEHRRRRPGHQA
jgi:hypothetical protein